MNNENSMIPLRSANEQYECFKMMYILYLSRNLCGGHDLQDISSFSMHEKIYSLFLSVYDFDTGNYEEKFVFDIASDDKTANKIFGLVSHGLVTPMTACDVISDLLCEI